MFLTHRRCFHAQGNAEDSQIEVLEDHHKTWPKVEFLFINSVWQWNSMEYPRTVCVDFCWAPFANVQVVSHWLSWLS